MKIKKKVIYIIIGLVILLLIIGGVIFFFWKKNQNTPSTEDDDEDDEDYTPSSSNKTNPEWGFSEYSIPSLSPDISEAQAKEEILKAIWMWGAKKWTQQEIGTFLVKNSQRISQEYEKLYESHDSWDYVNFVEKLGEKYQQDIFFNPPNQSKFDQSIGERELELFFLGHGCELEYKDNGEIDWKTSIQGKLKSGKKKPKRKEQWQKIIDYIEREINPFILEHGKKFPNLTNLAELNQWTNVLATKIRIVEHLFFKRWQLAEKMKKKILPPNKTKTITTNDPKLKNKKFDLQPVLTIYKVQEEK